MANRILARVASASIAATILGGGAQAHEVWVERDGAGPARVYLGEPAEPVPPTGDPQFDKLKAPAVFTTDPQKSFALTRKTDHIEAAVAGPGDVRVRDAAVFEPWKSGETYTGAVFYARAGRSETNALLDLEIAPVAPGGDSFAVTFKGQPAPNIKVTVINPQRWSKTLQADAQGRVRVPATDSGRYLLGVNHTVDGPAVLGGREVGRVRHVSTLTFVNPARP